MRKSYASITTFRKGLDDAERTAELSFFFEEGEKKALRAVQSNGLS